MDIHWWMNTVGVLDERYDQMEDIGRARRLPSLQFIGTPEKRTLDLNALHEVGVQLVGRLAGVSGRTAQFSGSFANHCSSADLKLGRLLTALAYNPFAVGMGLDEDTAAFIKPGDSLEVVGSGGITIIDPSDLKYSSMDQARRGEPVSLIGVRLHILVAGGRYEIDSREAFAA